MSSERSVTASGLDPRYPSPTTNKDNKDPRHPLYLGKWKKSIPYEDSELARDNQDEPHHKRKQAILQAHPNVSKLYGTDSRTIPITICSVLTQLSIAWYFSFVENFSWLKFLVITYFGGASITALFGVIIHECAHNLAHPSSTVNRLLALIANTCIPVPIAASFRRYHLQHHTYQGVEDLDTDLPLEFEYKFIKGNPLLKLLWVFCYPLMYVVRGAAKFKPLSSWEFVNIAYTVAVNICIVKFLGWSSLAYLLASLWLGYGLHPGAAHFIQEHYTFDDGQETYSYYGILNKVYMNIGYHYEHHDFTQIPWSRLPKLKQLAPEFYTMKYHSSWVWTIVAFVCEDWVGPQSRVVRTYKDFKKARKGVKGT